MTADEVTGKGHSWFVRNINRQQAQDTGLAMVLLLLLIVHFTDSPRAIPLAIALLVLSMTWPVAFRPLAILWFSLANILGGVMSKVTLTIVFSLVVTPIGILRRLLGHDPLKLKQWKQDRASLFSERDHTYRATDLEIPF